ncbi:amidase [Siccirubricoccus deserti]|uniref:Amidase n=1 Tax=Siccirubricoccus deserti TaxID=2013562 RepID=A0A9X0QWD9_9PROT|nr:amidase [Siccirubricoccus deserti]MBC4014760.1 amidase [Siccirubricoccus deserti]GGC34741.1 amidase [Siccirubricoccus deserti]
MTEAWQLDATDIARLIRLGRLSAREATQSALDRLHAVNPRVNAVVRVLEAEALAAADAADAARARGETLGPLHGVPVTTKVNVDQKGLPTDNGVVAFRDAIAAEDGPVVANLRRAGAIIIGRTNTPAFSMRLFTDNELHGATLNPWDRGRTPGGSSGGAGAAAASGIGAIAMGNDIAGSIRWPAFCNGVVGLRPSLGRVSAMNPSQPLARTLSAQWMSMNGPLVRSVRDARLALAPLAARDVRDNRWTPAPLEGPPPARPIRVALVPAPDGAPTEPALQEAVRRAGKLLEAAGYCVEEPTHPGFAELTRLWHALGVTDVFGALGELILRHGDAGIRNSVESWVALHPPADLAGYRAAIAGRDAMLHRWTMFLEEYPLVVLPGGGEQALPVGLDTSGVEGVKRALAAAHTQVGLPVLGLPVLAVPLGQADGLPLGVQVMAGRFREDLALDAGEVIEAAEGPMRPIDPRW